MNALVRSHVPNGIQCLAIYIAEAHARDQWPAGKIISCVNQPTTLEQRLQHAREFIKKYNFQVPMLVDTMENTFHHTYGSWPFRFYIIYQGKLILKVEPNKTTFTYDINEIDRWTNDFYQTRCTQTV
ncbi:hypothetical protein I4U23_024609 [Adineta vaga]|nr:hypothetical protein I4U23_024609 [Adineta vaga]